MKKQNQNSANSSDSLFHLQMQAVSFSNSSTCCINDLMASSVLICCPPSLYSNFFSAHQHWSHTVLVFHRKWVLWQQGFWSSLFTLFTSDNIDGLTALANSIWGPSQLKVLVWIVFLAPLIGFGWSIFTLHIHKITSWSLLLRLDKSSADMGHVLVTHKITLLRHVANIFGEHG